MHNLKMPRMWKNNDKRRIAEEITKELCLLRQLADTADEGWNERTSGRLGEWATGRLGEGANYIEVQINIINQKTK